jgi:Nif-specific regulatory protein
MQVKLLRVLQEQEFEPVGSSRTIKVDVRVIAATNRNLEEEVAAGRFRADLFYRLNVLPISVPPLRERQTDIPQLVMFFIQRHAKRVGRIVEGVSRESMERLTRYRWPGNVRELEHAVERAVILANGPTIKVGDLPPEVTQRSRRRGGDDTLDLQAQERASIERALERFGGNRKKAAEALNISTVTLWRRLKQYGLTS